MERHKPIGGFQFVFISPLYKNSPCFLPAQYYLIPARSSPNKKKPHNRERFLWLQSILIVCTLLNGFSYVKNQTLNLSYATKQSPQSFLSPASLIQFSPTFSPQQSQTYELKSLALSGNTIFASFTSKSSEGA